MSYHRLAHVVITILMILLLSLAGCVPMQTRKGYIDSQVRQHPEFETILAILHQQDGEVESLLVQLQQVREELAALKGKCGP